MGSKNNLAATIEKAQEKLAYQQEREHAIQEMLIPKVREKNIFYVADEHRYLTYKPGRGWKTYLVEAMYKFLGLTDETEKHALDIVLRADGRVKETTTISFHESDPDVLNFLSKEDWLKPSPGPYNAILDIVMSSLSDGKTENREHLEKCLVYKYQHPAEYRVPCITISGSGGGSKNDFIELTLATIFTELQVVALGTDAAFGQFNGQMIGKTVVYIDEAIVEKGDAESLKRKVGNKTITINEKYGIQGTYDNTPWYWLGGNGTNGAVMLAKDVTDRRYSVLTIKHSVMYWVCKHLGLDPPRIGEVLPDSHSAVIWYRENAWALSDKEQVAHWLHSLIEKWGSQKFVPSALHAGDYEAVVQDQKSAIEETMEFVFLRPNFKHIEGKTLYRVYKLICDDSSDERIRVKKRNNFLADARHWIEKNAPDVEWKKSNIKTNEKSKTSATVFTSESKNFFTRNDRVYIKTDDRGNDSLVEVTTAIREECDPETDLIN